LAEGVGFEPTMDLRPRQFREASPSACRSHGLMAGAEPEIELLAGHWPPPHPGFLSIARASIRLAARRTYSFFPGRCTEHRPLADAPVASARDQNRG